MSNSRFPSGRSRKAVLTPDTAWSATNIIESESHPLRLGALVVQGLVGGADPAIKNRLHVLSSRLLSAPGGVPMVNATTADGRGGLFWMTSGPCPWGQSPKPILPPSPLATATTPLY